MEVLQSNGSLFLEKTMLKIKRITILEQAFVKLLQTSLNFQNKLHLKLYTYIFYQNNIIQLKNLMRKLK